MQLWPRYMIDLTRVKSECFCSYREDLCHMVIFSPGSNSWRHPASWSAPWCYEFWVPCICSRTWSLLNQVSRFHCSLTAGLLKTRKKTCREFFSPAEYITDIHEIILIKVAQLKVVQERRDLMAAWTFSVRSFQPTTRMLGHWILFLTISKI